MEITLQDAYDLKKQFDAYTETAEQHEFALLALIDLKLSQTIEHYEEVGYVDDQKDAKTMFRVVLKAIGKDYSKYINKEDFKNDNT